MHTFFSYQFNQKKEAHMKQKLKIKISGKQNENHKTTKQS